MIEAGLQATRLMLTDIDREINDKLGFVIKVDKFQFKAAAHPGNTLSIRSQFVSEILGMVQADITIKNEEGILVAKGSAVVREEKNNSVAIDNQTQTERQTYV